MSDIEAKIVGQNIICWIPANDLERINALWILYHFLSIRLAKIGLTLRGSLTIGGFRIAEEAPNIIFGPAAAQALQLIPTIQQMYVVIQSSIIEKTNAVSETSDIFDGVFVNRVVHTTEGQLTLVIFTWAPPTVASEVESAYRRLVGWVREKDKSLLTDEIQQFLRFFSHSDLMIETCMKDTADEMAELGPEWDIENISEN